MMEISNAIFEIEHGVMDMMMISNASFEMEHRNNARATGTGGDKSFVCEHKLE